MIRLKDIAARANCTPMTVSKALRGASDISAETRTRIKLLAQQMGYVPDSMAQCLRSRKTRLLGLVISTVTNPVFARTVAAIEERTHELGYDLILAHTLNSPEREEACIRRMLGRRVDGLFLFPVYRLSPTAPVYQDLTQRQVPVVIMGHNAPFCESFVNVETDDLKGAFQLTQYLLGLGHKRIAFFTGPMTSPHALERLEGYRRALRDASIEPDDRLIFTAGSTIEEGEKAAQQLINESVRVTAVQTANDLVAIGAVNVLLANKVRIPHDLSVAGYGNILMSEHCKVPLTTVRQPKHRLGTTAMEIMQKLLRGEKCGPVRLPADLLIRSSTAAAKG